jgi:hypothetical protein
MKKWLCRTIKSRLTNLSPDSVFQSRVVFCQRDICICTRSKTHKAGVRCNCTRLLLLSMLLTNEIDFYCESCRSSLFIIRDEKIMRSSSPFN